MSCPWWSNTTLIRWYCTNRECTERIFPGRKGKVRVNWFRCNSTGEVFSRERCETIYCN